MLKTNSKKARLNILDYIAKDGYIIERAEFDGREADILGDPEKVAAYAWELFKGEKKGDIEQNYGCASFAIFKDWAQGLALGWLFCYYYNRSAVDDLGDILEETEAERSKYTESEAEDLLTRLIYREMQNAYNRAK